MVNANGDLIGINTAITSETGSYVGYAFAVPSNIARKVVEDILEYGNVQRVLLGISGVELNSKIATELGVNHTKGIYIRSIEEESAAANAGLQEGDVLSEIDRLPIKDFSDLTGYLDSKRPNDRVRVKIFRQEQEMLVGVTLLKIEKYAIPELGIEIKEPSKESLEALGLKNGVMITSILAPEMRSYQLEGAVITKVNDREIYSIGDLKNILQQRRPNQSLSMQLKTKTGETHSFIFR